LGFCLVGPDFEVAADAAIFGTYANHATRGEFDVEARRNPRADARGVLLSAFVAVYLLVNKSAA
jgi:hypothetical protein